jgi:Na+-translocating ferredoxin:NAD+ oxidoreductase RnfG subunit
LARLLGVVALTWLLVRNATLREAIEINPQQWEGLRRFSQVVTTSPEGDHIHGWAGPSEVWLAFDADGLLSRARVANSADSEGFVDRIERDPDFFPSLFGGTPQSAAEWSVDAVSGATLTSRAIQGAVRARFAGDPLPNPFGTLSESEWNTPAGGFSLRAEPPGGVGFQGPTDAVLNFGADGKVVELRILESFDNQRWVEDIGFERSFFTGLHGLTLEEVAALKVGPEGVEGVSGATMTSQGIVLSLQNAAQQALQEQEGASQANASMARTPRELLGWILGGVALLILLSPLRRRRAVRGILRVAVILGFGVGAGALLSLDSAWAWAQHGLPWQSAPLLAGFVLASVIGPAILGRKTYCRSLCAHGAAQQWFASRATRKLPVKLDAVLRRLPAALLFFALVLLTLGSVRSLAAWEPFAAWTFDSSWMPIVESSNPGPHISLFLFLGSLIAARFVPLAYCHYACPTGALLEYFRYQPKQFFKQADLGLVALLVLASLN